MQRRADYYIHGRGRGHASRGPAILEALASRGYSVRVHAGGDALDLIGGDGRAAFELGPRPPLLPGPLAPLRLLRRAVADAWALPQARPDLVVSDGDQAALLASRLHSVPSLAVGHDLVFSGKVQLPPLPSAALRVQRLNTAPLFAAHRGVAVHFLPAQSSHPSLELARPETLDALEAPSELSDEVLCYFRDKNGSAVVRRLRDAGCRVQWFGADASTGNGVHARPISEQAFRRALTGARAVVCSAGSNVLAECVMAQKPVLALYRERDSEQLLNATLIERADVGVAVSFESLGARDVERFISRCERDDFARVDLKAALPPVSRAVERAVEALQASSSA